MDSEPVGLTASQLDASVDALSDVLDLIQLRGEALTVVRAEGAADVHHQASERLAHLVEQGPVDVTTSSGEQVRLDSGDMVLLATGVTHRLRSTGTVAWLSGRFFVEEKSAAPLLAVLPPVIVIRAAELELPWLPLASQLMSLELGDPSAGSRVMVSRLLDLVFIRALRTWAAGSATKAHPGWLTGALDRPLGPALRAIHRNPELPWPVEELAELASMSRAAFAGRFTQLVGEPPGRYIARLRLARAADLLAMTTETVGTIGRSVGYESEAAFSRAFAREFGSAPRDWRSSSRLGGIDA
jgi:AraC-like DNA-binding protein